MRNITFLFAALLSAAVSASANTYRGSITQTVTSTNDPLHSLGETFTGWYQYESDTIDGAFAEATAWACVNPEAEKSLIGSLYAFCPYDGNGLIDLGHSLNRFLTQLVVTDGLVSFFYLYGNLGSTDYDYWTDSFLIQNQGMTHPTYKTRGTLEFSGPELVTQNELRLAAPVTVPENLSTLLLLGGVLAFMLTYSTRSACSRSTGSGPMTD